jgi:hypothetical protein
MHVVQSAKTPEIFSGEFFQKGGLLGPPWDIRVFLVQGVVQAQEPGPPLKQKGFSTQLVYVLTCSTLKCCKFSAARRSSSSKGTKCR